MKKTTCALLNLLISLEICIFQAQAHPIDRFLDRIEERFDKAATNAARYDVVSQPINRVYLESLEEGQPIRGNLLYVDISRDPFLREAGDENSEKTCPLALAVSLGRVYLVDKFLTAVKDPNAPELATWGYRQPYTLAHLALDPRYPLAPAQIGLKDRLMIVDAIAEKGANFNAILYPNPNRWIHTYRNPPLAAGESHYHQLNIINHVRARALLYGADPSFGGSSFHGVKDDLEHLAELAFPYFIERTKAGATLTPVPAVMAALDQAAQGRAFDLRAFRERIAPINAQRTKIKKQVQGLQIRLERLKDQKTKKAKREASRISAAIQDLQAEMKRLNRQARKL
jgi:hypothetical protein